MDDKDLMIQALREALKERVATITDDYEFRIAQLRIEITHLMNRLNGQNESVEIPMIEEGVPIGD